MELLKSALDGIGLIIDTLPNFKAIAVAMYDIIASNAVLSLSFIFGVITFIAEKVSHSR